MDQVAGQPPSLQKGFVIPPLAPGPTTSAETSSALVSSPPQATAPTAATSSSPRQDPMGKKIMTGRFVDF